MSARAVFFDFGGVLMRTEYQSPRQQLAERFNMDYEEIDRLVFGSDSARRATLGEITEDAHWLEILRRLKQPASELYSFRSSFFGGDVIDRQLVDRIRKLRGEYHTGLISNAWSGARDFLTREKLTDIFDTVTISAEVGAVKPMPQIFQLALDRAQVQASDAIFVDDVQENIDAARQLGMPGILFKDPQQTLKKLDQLLNSK